MSENDDNITTVRLDEDINEWRQTKCNNFSAKVNELVREYINGGERGDAIRKYRMQEIEGDIDSLTAQLNVKREKLQELRDRDDPKAEEYKDEIEDMAMVAPDPKTSPIQRVAKEYGKDPMSVAEDIAKMHNKEVSDTHDFNY